MTWFAPEAESKYSIKIEGARKVITGKLFSVGVSARELSLEHATTLRPLRAALAGLSNPVGSLHR